MINKLHLKDFRNFEEKLIEFSPKTTVIVGPNASGKTNILEAVNLLSTGKSFRARVEEEMVKNGEEIARIKAMVGDIKLEVILTRGEITLADEKIQKAPRKRLLIDGVGKRLFNFAGILKVVLFVPQDLEIVTGSPSHRRRFMDDVLNQVDREYRRASLSYDKGLRQRNRLLYRIREEGVSRSQLLFWDKLLIKNGDYISQKRQQLLEFINQTGAINDQVFSLDYDKSGISEGRLEQYANEEIAAATTLVGPHRDDFCFFIGKGERDLSRFGSRGEQRMGMLWLKLTELNFIEKSTETKPTLLLDDIFSELDHKHREVVMAAVENHQAIITTADPHFVEGIKGVERIEL